MPPFGGARMTSMEQNRDVGFSQHRPDGCDSRWEPGDLAPEAYEGLAQSLPLIERARFNWLADAEVSFRVDGKGLGLSWFFTDPFEYEAFCGAYEFPEPLNELASRMYSRFELAPRRWVKMHLLSGRVVGYSLYFIVDPRNDFPLTTLRLGLRDLGLPHASRIEPAFGRVLGQAGSLWAMIAKCEEDSIAPRLSCLLDRTSLPTVISDSVRAGFLSAGMSKRLTEVDQSINADGQVYFSVDLDHVDACSLDYTQVAEPPPEVLPFYGSLPGRRYLKVRPTPTDLLYSVYRPLPDILRVVRRGYSAREIATRYDRLNKAIVRTYGHTYQAGDFTSGGTVKRAIEVAGMGQGDRVLDCGCGAGGPAIELAQAGAIVTGVTLSGEQARTAEDFTARQGLQGLVSICQGDYHALPFARESFDHVVFFESLGYGDVEVALKESARVLRPGGRVYIKEPLVAMENLDSRSTYEVAEFDRVYGLKTPSMADVLRSLAAAGLELTSHHIFGSEMDAAAFHGKMLESGQLNEFGKEHYRSFQELPVVFCEFTATKAG